MKQGTASISGQNLRDFLLTQHVNLKVNLNKVRTNNMIVQIVIIYSTYHFLFYHTVFSVS